LISDCNSKIYTFTYKYQIAKRFENIADVKERDDYISIDNGNFIALAYKSKRFVEIKINPKENDLIKVLNYCRKILA